MEALHGAPIPGTRSGGLFVGRLVAENGIATLAEALDLYPGTCLRVIGAGPKRARLEPHPRVTFLGRMKLREVQAWMRGALYLVLPTLACEETPPELIEAFACGLPVIGSRLPPVADAVEEGRNGLLFQPGSARDLARRLAWAEAFPERMRQMGECARADYEARYAIGAWARPHEAGAPARALRIPSAR